jgi:hypothetical protein
VVLCRRCSLAQHAVAAGSEPGLLGCLRGDSGEAWRIFVMVAVGSLWVLLATGLEVAVSVPDG